MTATVIAFPKRYLPPPPAPADVQSAYELMMSAQRILWAKQAQADGVAK
jgi:hypothetical protein